MTRRVQRFLSDYDSQLVTEALRREFDRLVSVPFLEGELIKNVSFTPGDTVQVTHNLRRVPQGWMVVRQVGDVDIARNGAYLINQEAQGFQISDWTYNGSLYELDRTLTFQPEVGTFLVMAFVFSNTTNVDISSVSHTGANQWRSGHSSFNTSDSVQVNLWYLQPAENFGVKQDLTILRGGAGRDGAVIFAEYGGVSTTQDASFHDQRQNDNNGNLVDPDNSAMTSGLITPAISNSLGLALFGIEDKNKSMRSTGSFDVVATATGDAATASNAGRVLLLNQKLGANTADSLQADARLSADDRWAGATINFPTADAFEALGYPVETARSTRQLTLKHASTVTCDLWVF